MAFEGCCGQLPKKRARRVPPTLAANPNPAGGVKIIYVGSGYAEVPGKISGLTYVVADYRRHFKAHPDDVAALLRSRDFILEP
jgi:hypothetical protein